MQKTFTKNHLLLLLYKELNPKDSIALLEAMRHNWSLREEYNRLKKAYLSLPKRYFSPSKSTVNSILAYSRKNHVTAQA